MQKGVFVALAFLWAGLFSQLAVVYWAATEYGWIGALVAFCSFMPAWVTAMAAGRLATDADKTKDALKASGPVVDSLFKHGMSLGEKVDVLNEQVDMLWRTRTGSTNRKEKLDG